MSFKLFPRQRTAPASTPLFSSGALTLSARVQWLDSTGLVDPTVSCIASVVIGAISKILNGVQTMLPFNPKVL